MTIDEYKVRFAEIFREMEEEHGHVKSVEIYKTNEARIIV